MTTRGLAPRIKGERKPERRVEREGLLSFQRDMNRLFDDFFRSLSPMRVGDFGLPDTWERDTFAPPVNMSETDKEVIVSAELPGMDEKDVNIEVDDDVLTIRGEKKEEHEEKGRDWYRTEQAFGSFHRSIALPAGVKADKAKATFKKGVLTVTLPKKEEDQGRRKTIEIKTE